MTKNEVVLVISEDDINIIKNLNGIKELSSDMLYDLYDVLKKKSVWKSRIEVENDPSWKQIIPYTILIMDNYIYIYKRLSGSGEKRLIDLYSVGFGGHISYSTYYKKIMSLPDKIIEHSIRRELYEEMGLLPGDYDSPRIIGLLYAGKSEDVVDLVHVGIVNVVKLNKPVVNSNEKNVLGNLDMISLYDLDEYDLINLDFERWSNIVLRWIIDKKNNGFLFSDVLASVEQ